MNAECKLRLATPTDARSITETRVKTWRSNYKGIVPDDFLAAMNIEEEVARRTKWLGEVQPGVVTIVAECLDEGVVGFTMSGPIRKPFEAYDGEVYAIYVLPEVQGRGIGRQLFEKALENLKGNKFKSCLIWTLKENSSVRFYEKMGGKIVAEDQMEIGKLLPIVGFGWPKI